MQRTAIILAAFTFLSVYETPWQSMLSAQPVRTKNARDNRAGKQRGEVIAPADRSEQWKDRLVVGSSAPEFKLPLLDKIAKEERFEKVESKTVSLRELCSTRPAVLIFGSITCPPFRGQLDGVNQVYEDFKDQAEFLFIYIREAHPDSVLSVVADDGQESLLKISQAADLPGRKTSAAVCQRTEKLSLPIAVDDIDNSVGKAYAGWPNRMVVVGIDGKITYASNPAPGGTNSQRLRAWLEENLKANGS